MVQALILIMSVMTDFHLAYAESGPFEWSDPVAPEVITLEKGSYELAQTGESKSCTFAKSEDASVLARFERNGRKQALVAIRGNPCRQKFAGVTPKGAPSLVWVENPDQAKIRKDRKNLNLCEPFRLAEQLEVDLGEQMRRVEGGTCDTCTTTKDGGVTDGGPGPKEIPVPRMVGATAQDIGAASDFEKNNPCLIDPSRSLNSAECSFAALLEAAKKSRGNCVENLKKLSCRKSPWKDMGIEERFNQVVKLAVEKSQNVSRFKSQKKINKSGGKEAKGRGVEIKGVDYRAIPCISIVETEYLEPMAKSLGACQNPGQNRYHGLGMLTLSTLRSYVNNPNGNIQIGFSRSGDLSGSDTKTDPEDFNRFAQMAGPSEIEFNVYRSNHVEFSKPSYYACPERLHDAMGISPELQVELMAYTLADKKNLAEGKMASLYQKYNPGVKKEFSSDWTTFALYNANPSSHGGRPHFAHYADAAMMCMNCLRERLDDNGNPIDGKGKPVECLSPGLRAEPRKGTGFHMKMDDLILRDFPAQIEARCGNDQVQNPK